ncbi:MAG: methyltransferase domain-containing protein [Planctomycetes bacterium]|nr:methyltransferase domain-containing protein [Planctomycetota bacterium]
MDLGAAGQVLDIGTGPGTIPLLLCSQHASCEVVGVDLSTEMLKLAEEHRQRSEHASRVRFQLADAKGLGFADHSFDCVCSNTILHHIPDPEPFLAEAWRVLKPGGVLLIRDLFRPQTAAKADQLVQLHASNEPPLSQRLFRDSLGAALTPDELEKMAFRAGLTDFHVVVDSDRHMSLQSSVRH